MLTNITNISPEEAEETIQTVTGFFNDLNLQKIITIVLLFVGCMVVMKVILRLTDRAFLRLEMEKSLHTFIHAALRVILWLITLCIVLDYIGVPMTSLVAVLGVIGLAVSLAIQGTLSNLAGGIQVLVSKPFKAGDFVEAGGVSGTVKEVGLAYTKLSTFDNKVISVPNGQISAEKIINYTTAEQRRVDLKFNTSYDDKPEQVIAANSTTYVPKDTTITITSVGEGSKVIRTNTAGVGNATYQYDVDSTMTIGQDYDLYSAAQVTFNAGKVMIGATEIKSMDYVAIDVDLTVTPSGTGAASVAIVDGVSKVSDVNVAVDGYTMTKDNVQFYTAWQVTLNNVTAKVGSEVVNDGDYVVNGQTVKAEVVSGTGTDVVTLDGKAGTKYTDAAITGDLNLAAATKVTVTSDVKSLTYEGKNGPVTLTDGTTITEVYVLADTKLTATVAAGNNVKVTGADAETEGNTATFTVGTSAISVSKA